MTNRLKTRSWLFVANILLAAVLLHFSAFTSFSQEICERYGSIHLSENAYIVQNNVWGSEETSQCIDVGLAGFRVTVSDHNNDTGGKPASYPMIYKGCHYTHCTSDSKLGVPVKNIKTLSSNFEITTPVAGVWNSAFDLWFDEENREDGKNTGLELMIWLYYLGSIQPAGEEVELNVLIDGEYWNVWIKNSGNNETPYIAYYRSDTSAPLHSLALKKFIDDASRRGMVNKNWFLTSVQAGFEIWEDGVGLEISNFDNHVEHKPLALPGVTFLLLGSSTPE